MGKYDLVSARYFADEERYADLLNGYVFGGRSFVRPEDVLEQDTRETGLLRKFFVPGKRLAAQRYRDIVRKVVFGTEFVVVGLEHQNLVHYAMPVRVMLEDAMGYDGQLRKIQKRHRREKDLQEKAEYVGGFSAKDRLAPVVTIVVYWSEEPWNGARDLGDLLCMEGLPEELKEFVNGYPIHILEVCRFSHIDRFRTDLREVFGFIQRAGDKKRAKAFVEQHQEAFEHLEEDAYDVISTITGSAELAGRKEQYQEEGGTFNMCQAIREMIEDGRIEGRQEGKREGAQIAARNLYARGISVSETAAICEVSEEQAREWFSLWDKRESA